MRNLDGVYIRIERENKHLSLSFSDSTDDEQQQFLDRLDKEGLQRMCKLLADELRAQHSPDTSG